MSRNKRPTSIQIMGIPFRIQWGEEHMRDKEAHGESNLAARVIRVNSEKHDDVPHEMMTLWHEVIHMVLGMTGQAETMEDNEEESMVLALEHGLWPLVNQFAAWRK